MASMSPHQQGIVWLDLENEELDIARLDEVYDRETRDYLIALYQSGFLTPPSSNQHDNGNSTAIRCPVFIKALLLKTDLQQRVQHLASLVTVEQSPGKGAIAGMK